MDGTILLFLMQDGLTNGAIYALLGFALVLVFTVTRIIFIPQGEFVAYGALTYAVLRAGGIPGTIWLLMVFGAAAFAVALWRCRGRHALRSLIAEATTCLVVPALVAATVLATHGLARPAAVDVLITVVIVAALGPHLFRVAFEPLADASVLTLFIAAVAVHLAMTALGLAFFGAEGLRAPPIAEGGASLGPLFVTGQSVAVYVAALVASAGLWLFFGATLYGKALRATASNRIGARLVGIGTGLAGRSAFTLAAALGAVSGILIVPVTTIYYDTGFLIGLKGFVAAIVGGLGSYPLAGVAAVSIGMAEAFASFQASAYKEVIVFALVIPVLLFRSLGATDADHEE